MALHIRGSKPVNLATLAAWTRANRGPDGKPDSSGRVRCVRKWWRRKWSPPHVPAYLPVGGAPSRPVAPDAGVWSELQSCSISWPWLVESHHLPAPFHETLNVPWLPLHPLSGSVRWWMGMS